MSRLRLTKIATPSSPPTMTAELFYSTTDSKLEAVDESGNVMKVGGFGTLDFRLIRVTNIFQGTTTYTPTTGVRALYVECIGGGAAGGGGAAASSNISMGSGGGSGAYSALWISPTSASGPVASSYTVAVGAGGTGVSGTTGNGGGNTTFGATPLCAAYGGAGGLTIAAGTTLVSSVGGAGGASSSGAGDIKFDGSDGGACVRLSASAGAPGSGGAAPIGGSAVANWGEVGRNYGGGGSGNFTTSSSTTAGGAGANGLIRVWEFA